LAHLLNDTVCDNARVGVVPRPDGLVGVGTSIDRRTYQPQPQRLRTINHAFCWLTVSARLYLDEDKYLTVERSAWIVSTGPSAEHQLFHYDYERGKDRYAEAHVQVEGRNAALEELLEQVGRPRKSLSKLHLPVGGKRFRPALEDVLEFLISEGIVDSKPYAADVLERYRSEFRRLQLKAAIRRDPDTAAAALRTIGYTCDEPASTGLVLPFTRRRRREIRRSRNEDV
jgi:hypothetical protein